MMKTTSAILSAISIASAMASTSVNAGTIVVTSISAFNSATTEVIDGDFSDVPTPYSGNPGEGALRVLQYAFGIRQPSGRFV